ncbi:carbamoyltransferase HypF [Methylibium sp.]|uniref:carbamoyltransferase HypF n=1 Tax=Methylibium sp. TaxID=2067992 RepID=UPI003D10B920
MNPPLTVHTDAPALACERLRVRGTVQGVGLRPTVWRLASELGVAGSVANDADGVLIVAVATASRIDELVQRLRSEAPPLARVAAIEREPLALPASLPTGFVIAASRGGAPTTAVAADAAMCAECLAEIVDPFARRFRYPLTNCTHCGPRLSFVTGVPYDRAQTTMAGYTMCAACRAEYEAPADRRFHAQPIACHACGPKVVLKRLDGRAFALDRYTFLDDCDAAGTLLAKGQVLAIKGLGGYQLACDATQPDAVRRLREIKRRERKPFALMAASLEAVRAWCCVDDAEAQLLQSPAAPVVLLVRRHPPPPLPQPAIADAVAPGLGTLGFMLPSTGLHHLMLRRMTRPIVLTSGNLSDEPQATTLAELTQRFGGQIDFVLDHDRPIARRVDDSVMRVADGAPRVLRRARGLVPAPIALPPGFEAAPPVLAYGGELKNTFCLLRGGTSGADGGHALLSQHIGDLEDAATQADYRRALRDLQSFFGFEPLLRACDRHPDYLSSKLAREETARDGGTLVEVGHHHAHLAACLADNGWPLEAGPVLGVALDGLGYGEDGSFWGGEFGLAGYRTFERLGTFKPVALLGGEQAMREPWRNTYAHLMAEMGWAAFTMNYAELELHAFLTAKPRELLDAMLKKRLNSPLASSCGRLFDAAAAAMGLCRERAAYEGQGAIEMEALVDAEVLAHEDEALGYPFTIPRLKDSGLPYIEPLAMWSALLGDLILKTPVPVMAARFHKGLALAIVKMVDQLAHAGRSEEPQRHVALSGGVFQNKALLEGVATRLRAQGYTVLTHRQLPCNDGGLALGQAVVAAARALPHQETPPCA